MTHFQLLFIYKYTTQSYIHISTCICPHATSHRLSAHTTLDMLAMQLSTASPATPASMSRGN